MASVLELASREILVLQGKFDEAMPLYEEALCIKRKLFGNEHPRVANGLNNLALLLKNMVVFRVHMLLFVEPICLKLFTSGQV